jgi:thermitase
VSRFRRQTNVPIILLLTLLLVAAAFPPAAGAGADEVGPDRIPGQVLVRFKDNAPGAAVAEARRAVGAQERSRIDQLGVHVWRVPEHASVNALRALQRNPHVEYAELDVVVEVAGEVVPNDPWLRFQWGLNQVNAPGAWAATTGSPTTRIAILDTGVSEVGDLRGKVLRGHNVLDGSTNATDNHGHGTRSASVAAVATDNGDGIAAYCWSCMILPVKVMDGGTGTMSDLARGITWAADSGAHVISMSLSGASGTSTVQQAVRYAQDRGAVLVAAAGNQGDTVPRYPAAYSEVIGVAATDSSDTRYSWSNHGSWVDVSAPGINYSVGRDGTIGTYAGTSSATPAAAGVLGLAVSVGATGPQARAALQDTAAPLPFVRFGRVDAAAVVAAVASDSAPATPEPAPAPAPGPAPVPPSEPEPPIALSVTTSKVRGLGSANLRWTGATSSQVEVRVDGSVHATINNAGRYTHETGQRGNPTITYQVCEARTQVCSARATVSSW